MVLWNPFVFGVRFDQLSEYFIDTCADPRLMMDSTQTIHRNSSTVLWNLVVLDLIS